MICNGEESTCWFTPYVMIYFEKRRGRNFCTFSNDSK